MPRDLMDFLAFLKTPQSLAVLERAGLAHPSHQSVPSMLSERVFTALPVATDAHLDALQTLAAELVGAEQLSMALLPAATRRDLRALSEASFEQLSRVSRSQGRLVLVAHADTVAQAEADAGQILLELRNARGEEDMPEIRVVALGDALPVACPDAAWATEMNRRIDVWQVPATDSPRRGN